MATRQTTPGSNLAVLAPTNSLKRALSEDADSDSVLPDPKKIKSENTPQAKDKKKRRKKKKKTPVVVPLELPTSGTNAAPASALFSPIATPLRSSMSSGKGKRKAASAPPVDSGDHKAADAERRVQVSEGSGSSSTAIARLQGHDVEEGPSTASDNAESSSAIIARLNQELNAQSILLQKHETTLAHFNQSLTCQVCLDLLHKPYALAPCGHIACYNCLVAWFTSEPEENRHYRGPRKKTCPNCRATIKERPVEVWNLKEMVAGLLKSGLVGGLSTAPPLPPALPGPPQPADAQPDPWHNIFRYHYQHPRFHPPPLHGGEPPSVEDMGMLDMEDGGVYRCLDCMHEIWDGICTSCQREYPGHHRLDEDDDDGHMFGGGDSDDDDDDDGGPIFWPGFLPMHPGLDFPGPGFNPQWWNHDDDDDDDEESDVERAIHGAEDGYDSFIDDGDDDEAGSQRAAEIIEIDSDSGSERGSPERRTSHNRRLAVNRRVLSSDDEESDVIIAAPPTRRLRAAIRSSSPIESEVIVVNDDVSDTSYTPRRSRRVQHIYISDDEDGSREQSDHEHSDNESNTASSRYNSDVDVGMNQMDAANLMHLLRQFEDPHEDSEDGHSQTYSDDGW